MERWNDYFLSYPQNFYYLLPYSSLAIYGLGFYFKKHRTSKRISRLLPICVYYLHTIFPPVTTLKLSTLLSKVTCLCTSPISTYLLKDSATAEMPSPASSIFPSVGPSYQHTSMLLFISSQKQMKHLSWLHILLHLMSHFSAPFKATSLETVAYTHCLKPLFPVLSWTHSLPLHQNSSRTDDHRVVKLNVQFLILILCNLPGAFCSFIPENK